MARHFALVLAMVLCVVLASGVGGAITSGSLRDEELAPTPTPTSTGGPSATTKTSEIDARLAEAVDAVRRDGAIAGRQAHAAFCTCDSRIHGSGVCAAVTSQCRSMFCNPICLNMAWSVELDVDCAAAPGWKYCDVFKQQVLAAEKAISSQFQAHVCVAAQFCNRTAAVVDWVENHTYGNRYPEHMLPIAACLPSLHELHPAVAASTCQACGQVVTAKIRRGTCVPGFTPGYETKEMGSVQERCEFVADYISTHAHSLLLDLQQSVCTCLGCCDASGADGRKECYLPNTESTWLSGLIDRVTKGVSQRIHQERQADERRQAERKRHPRPPKPNHFDDQMKMDL